MSEAIRNFSMPSARNNLRQAVHALDPAAVEYIDWDMFEKELDELFSGKTQGVSKQHVLKIFAQAVSRARLTYLAAVREGVHWTQ